MKKRLLFLTLNTFSATGGIEKICRTAAKALHELSTENNVEMAVYSLYDRPGEIDERYFPLSVFKGFGNEKIKFALAAVRKGRTCDVVLLSHINLLPIGFLIKKTAPKTKLVLLAHGIEVWSQLPRLKSNMLHAVDLFLSVSSFTANKLKAEHKIAARKIRVLNNCLDPFLTNEEEKEKANSFKKTYGIGEDDFVLLTVTRLKHSEQYKGYDRVVEALAAVKKNRPSVKYLIVGRYDAEEKKRLDAIISENGLTNAVIFTGFVKDEDLSSHFKASDCYIMPSTGEGFGIVFIEALFYGLPVIAGNADGSVDALAGGKFGLLVNPTSIQNIADAILEVVKNKPAYVPEHSKVMEQFGFGTYKKKIVSLIQEPMVRVAKTLRINGEAAT